VVQHGKPPPLFYQPSITVQIESLMIYGNKAGLRSTWAEPYHLSFLLGIKPTTFLFTFLVFSSGDLGRKSSRFLFHSHDFHNND
jgi:hypothetical protein